MRVTTTASFITCCCCCCCCCCCSPDITPVDGGALLPALWPPACTAGMRAVAGDAQAGLGGPARGEDSVVGVSRAALDFPIFMVGGGGGLRGGTTTLYSSSSTPPRAWRLNRSTADSKQHPCTHNRKISTNSSFYAVSPNKARHQSLKSAMVKQAAHPAIRARS
jgi:hypothetical protein